MHLYITALLISLSSILLTKCLCVYIGETFRSKFENSQILQVVEIGNSINYSEYSPLCRKSNNLQYSNDMNPILREPIHQVRKLGQCK